jgi:hypothetical protein
MQQIELWGYRMTYCIIETDDGWTIAELSPERTAEDAAGMLGGAVIDPGPYDSYEDASDALVSLQEELAENGGTSDIPGTRAIESREAD